jgi:hypothetical protein
MRQEGAGEDEGAMVAGRGGEAVVDFVGCADAERVVTMLVVTRDSLLATLAGGLVNRALLTVGWWGALRRSALVALVEDASRTREGLVLTLRRSKTD